MALALHWTECVTLTYFHLLRSPIKRFTDH